MGITDEEVDELCKNQGKTTSILCPQKTHFND